MNKKFLIIVGVLIILVALFFIFKQYNLNIKKLNSKYITSSCSVLGIEELNPKDITSSSPVYFKYQGKVWYLAGGWGRGGPTIVDGADPENFRECALSVGQEYGVDKNFVYCAGHKIEGSNGPTFNDNDPNYAFDKNQVYYPYCNIIKGTDASSFKVVSAGIYAIDKRNVYIYGKIIDGADSGTFQILANGYMKDKNHIYYTHSDSPLKIVENADVNSFKFLDYMFAEDNNYIFYQDKIINGVDRNSFEIFDSNKYGNGSYAKDKNHVYLGNNVIVGADPSTFIVLESFGKDKNFVFYKGKKFDGSDGPSFKLKDGTCCEGSDKNYVYSYACMYKDNKQISCVKDPIFN